MNTELSERTPPISGFKERFEADLRPLVPSEEALVVTAAEGDPATCAWRGGSVVGAGPDFARLAVTKEARPCGSSVHTRTPH